jgi:cyclase
MYSTLIVARMDPADGDKVAELFRRFDEGGMPRLMGTRRRELFSYQGLYFHLQDFDGDGGAAIGAARSDPRFVRISEELRPYIAPYDPLTWRAPADAMARRFYHWAPPS